MSKTRADAMALVAGLEKAINALYDLGCARCEGTGKRTLGMGVTPAETVRCEACEGTGEHPLIHELAALVKAA
jgi:DnaJ-class molecular chaperone